MRETELNIFLGVEMLEVEVLVEYIFHLMGLTSDMHNEGMHNRNILNL